MVKQAIWVLRHVGSCKVLNAMVLNPPRPEGNGDGTGSIGRRHRAIREGPRKSRSSFTHLRQIGLRAAQSITRTRQAVLETLAAFLGGGYATSRRQEGPCQVQLQACDADILHVGISRAGGALGERVQWRHAELRASEATEVKRERQSEAIYSRSRERPVARGQEVQQSYVRAALIGCLRLQGGPLRLCAKCDGAMRASREASEGDRTKK